MSWPQVVLIVLMAVGGTIHLLYHGQTRKFNFGSWLFDAAVLNIILYLGGFWS